jgi:hypothetical protein
MSNRTSEANKAIALAWAKEQQLIKEGKGTRNWTSEQQRDILDRGKAYDDDGKAFEGHHMKSAEAFPEYQGDPENIQFLSRPEHFVAHDRNFQNPTNGYFDPSTGKTSDFGVNKFEPCEIIELSEPIKSISNQAQSADENTDTSANTRTIDANIVEPKSSSLKSQVMSEFSNTAKSPVDTFERLIGKGVKFYFRHKNLIDPFAKILFTIVGAVAVVVIKEKLGGNSQSNTSDYENDYDYDDTTSSPLLDENEENDEDHGQQEDIIGRSSPCENNVRAHKQRYNNKWKDKQPYTRSKKSDD